MADDKLSPPRDASVREGAPAAFHGRSVDEIVPVSQAVVDKAEADYCKAMSLYGRNSAEVLVARQYWMHLKTLHGRGAAAVNTEHFRRRT